jgi:predicted transposase YdaD
LSKIYKFQRRIIVYKFPDKSREEIERMLGLDDLKHTKVYQEALEEGKVEGRIKGKLESVPRFLSLGLSVEQIAQGLDLDVEQVKQTAISHLLASGRTVEQVAESLGWEVEAVRQIEASNAQSDESSKEE